MSAGLKGCGSKRTSLGLTVRTSVQLLREAALEKSSKHAVVQNPDMISDFASFHMTSCASERWLLSVMRQPGGDDLASRWLVRALLVLIGIECHCCSSRTITPAGDAASIIAVISARGLSLGNVLNIA